MTQIANIHAAGALQRLPLTVFTASLALATGLAAATLHAADPVIDDDDRRIYAVEGEWTDYREFVEDAITQEGMVINTVGHIADMLERTAADVGGEAIYRHGESLEFCSARYSRNMMEADPHSIVFCPYVVSVYELESGPGTVYVGYQKLPTSGDDSANAALEDVNELIERIVQGAIAF